MQAQLQAGPSSARLPPHRLPLRISLETPSDSSREPSRDVALSNANSGELPAARQQTEDPPASNSKNKQQIALYRHEVLVKNPNYSFSNTRQLMITEVATRCRGKTPYIWQLDLAEVILYGKDCVIIAGTGFGKTLPFVMPLLVDNTRQSKVLIVSTLNELERDQADRFNEMDLKALAVNGDSWNAVKNDIRAKDFRVILTSPEMILLHPVFAKLVRDADWMKDFLCVIVDEAHCIVPWGKDFRKAFADLGKLRSFMIAKPFLVASATLPPLLLDETLNILDFRRNDTFILNLGNDRSNVAMLMCRLQGGKSNLDALNFLLEELERGLELIRTIVYVTECVLAKQVYLHLVSLVPADKQDQIAFITGKMTERAKRRIMRLFREGVIKILCATEVAGMGMDIRDIRRVIQFLLPNTLSEWYQHAGRAGRDGLPAVAILMVEATAFLLKKIKSEQKATTVMASSKKIATKGKQRAVPDKAGPVEAIIPQKRAGQDDEANARDDLEDGPVLDLEDAQDEEEEAHEAVKKVETVLRWWFEAMECRRNMQDTYFNNPPRAKDRIKICCDICLRELDARQDRPLTDSERDLLALIAKIEGWPKARPDQNLPVIKPTRHPTKLQKDLSSALTRWRERYHRQHAQGSVLEPDVFMTDKTLKYLATYSHVYTEEHLTRFLPDWTYGSRVGKDVLELIGNIAAFWHSVAEDAREQKRLANNEAWNTTRQQARTALKNANSGTAVKQETATPGETSFSFYHGEDAMFVPESMVYQTSAAISFEPQQSSSQAVNSYQPFTSGKSASTSEARPLVLGQTVSAAQQGQAAPLPLGTSQASCVPPYLPPTLLCFAQMLPPPPPQVPVARLTSMVPHQQPPVLLLASAMDIKPLNTPAEALPSNWKVRFHDDLPTSAGGRTGISTVAPKRRRRRCSTKTNESSPSGMSKAVKSELMDNPSMEDL